MVERTKIGSPSSEASSFGLFFYNVEDVTGVPLSGADRITMVGETAASRAIALVASVVPDDANYTLSADSAASAFIAESFSVNGSLSVDAGVVVKGQITVSAGGLLNVTGTSTNPVVFTSPLDDTFGGDTNGDGSETSVERTPLAHIRIEAQSVESLIALVTSSIEGAVFLHAETAVSVGERNNLTIGNSLFLDNGYAVSVDHMTAGSDPALDLAWQFLPCRPPFNSTVAVTNSWAGANGFAGLGVDINAEDVLSLFSDKPTSLLPDTDEYDDIAATTLDEAWSTMLDVPVATVSSGDNQISWGMYDCTIPTVPPVVIKFPWFPVIFVPAVERPFPEIVG
ncbi:MAG: hypothetical protein QM622_03655 [Microbacterium sp.]